MPRVARKVDNRKAQSAPVPSRVMPRRAKQFHSEDVSTEQKDDIIEDERRPDIVHADQLDAKKDYLDQLAFNEEPVKIRLEPSSDKNAATAFPIWCNGTPCEVWIRGRWRQAPQGYIPVGIDLIVKRKYVAILAASKIDNVDTVVTEEKMRDPQNTVKRSTSASQAFTILQDDNPRGQAWFAELRRRNS